LHRAVGLTAGQRQPRVRGRGRSRAPRDPGACLKGPGTGAPIAAEGYHRGTATGNTGRCGPGTTCETARPEPRQGEAARHAICLFSADLTGRVRYCSQVTEPPTKNCGFEVNTKTSHGGFRPQSRVENAKSGGLFELGGCLRRRFRAVTGTLGRSSYARLRLRVDLKSNLADRSANGTSADSSFQIAYEVNSRTVIRVHSGSVQARWRCWLAASRAKGTCQGTRSAHRRAGRRV
jgi:hypothetical protein